MVVIRSRVVDIQRRFVEGLLKNMDPPALREFVTGYRDRDQEAA